MLAPMSANDKTRATPGGKTTRAVDDNDPDYRYPDRKVVQIVIYIERRAQNYFGLMREEAMKAHALLVPHNLELRVAPCLPTVTGDRDYLFDCSAGTSSVFADEWLEKSQKVHEARDDMLPVMFCVGDHPEEAGWASLKSKRPYVHVYVNHPCPDRVTLLHEIGHVAANNAEHESWDIDGSAKRYSFMATPAEFRAKGPGDKESERKLQMIKDPPYFRNSMSRKRVRQFAKAPFCVRTWDSYLPSINTIGA
jgi:hypothetical protein